MTKETYLNAVDKLLDAYNKGKLFHGYCHACAVGTLLGTSAWNHHFTTVKDGQIGGDDTFVPSAAAKLAGYSKNRLIYVGTKEEEKVNKALNNLYKEKGFTKEELMKIEFAFENSLYKSEEGYDFYTEIPENIKTGQYIGLCAVLDVMSTMVQEDPKDSLDKLKTIASEKFNVLV